ncbi:MAG: F-box/WD repeat-containing protein [Parachlamydiales bacterium]|nr:F-box/WD repeat-containing protein [Parachlamydiales bacterium]
MKVVKYNVVYGHLSSPQVIDNLPDEILMAIFKDNVSVNDIGKSMQVCKHWRVICSDNSIWNKIVEKIPLILKQLSLKQSHPFNAYKEHVQNKKNIINGDLTSKVLKQGCWSQMDNEVTFKNVSIFNHQSIFATDNRSIYTFEDLSNLEDTPSKYNFIDYPDYNVKCVTHYQGRFLISAQSKINSYEIGEYRDSHWFSIKKNRSCASSFLVINDQIITGFDNGKLCWGYDDHSEPIYHYEKSVQALALFKDGFISASISGEGLLHNLDGSVRKTYFFGPKFSKLVTSETEVMTLKNGRISLWESMKVIDLVSLNIISMAMLGEYIVYGTEDKMIHIWDKNLEKIKKFDVDSAVTELMTFNNQLVSISWDKTLHLWSFEPPKKIIQIP